MEHGTLRRKKRNAACLSRSYDLFGGPLSLYEENGACIHHLDGVEHVGVGEGCNEEGAGREGDEHLTDEIAGETILYFCIEKLVAAENFGAEEVSDLSEIHALTRLTLYSFSVNQFKPLFLPLSTRRTVSVKKK